MNIVYDIITDGFFAAIAGIGFGAISDPPMRAFKYIALLAAIGHACRFCLMTYFGFEITMASLAGSMVIGFGSIWLGKNVNCPMTVLYIPALLPMVPGKFAYNAIFAQIMFLQSIDNPAESNRYLDLFFTNFSVASAVIFMLAAGSTLPMLLFPKRAFSMTRHKHNN